MQHPVEIYTKLHCPYCQRAKDLLRIKGINFIEYVIDEDTRRAGEMRLRSGRETVPGIFVADRCIGGCTELFDLDESGELNRMLQITPE
jgi:glutaredoxin 3